MKNKMSLLFGSSILTIVGVIALSACGSQPVPPAEGFSYADVQVAASKIKSKKFYVDDKGKQRYDDTYVSGDPNFTGKIRVFVVPVEFTDAPASALPGGAEFQRNQIKEAYFGDPKTNPKLWESLASYYEKSSYGQVEIVGEVAPWFNCGLTVDQLADIYIKDYDNGNAGSAPFEILKQIYFEKTGFTSEGDFTQAGYDWANLYDENDDGFIDCISMVYSCHSYPNMTNIPKAKEEAYKDTFWAFTHSDFYQTPWLSTGGLDFDGVPSNYLPARYRFVWLSYDFLYENGYWSGTEYHKWTDAQIAAGLATIDAHTVIHEHGHALMGYPDYYTYDSGDWGPAGGLAMMDYNVGDHDAYSKMCSGWFEPTVITGPGTYTLKSLQEEGNALIVKAKGLSYNNTVIDEYLMLEYYTPDGLNKLDSEHPYSGTYPREFTIEGVKIYHVDARLGVFSYNSTSSSWKFSYYTDKPAIMGDNGKVDIAASNTASRSCDPEKRLLHLLESSGKNSFMNGAKATNDTLFVAGSSFGDKTFKGFTFNDGSALGYKIFIDSCANGVAKIRVE